MGKATRFVGLDVHADTIAVAVAEGGRSGEVRSVGTIPNQEGAVRRLVQKLGGPKGLSTCYEAGPTGYGLHRLIKELGGVNAVKRASLDDLTALAWLPDPVAHAIYQQLHAPPAKGAPGTSRVAAALAQLRASHED